MDAALFFSLSMLFFEVKTAPEHADEVQELRPVLAPLRALPLECGREP